jgi:uncharacterized protein YbjT (DUF2867 family)
MSNCQLLLMETNVEFQNKTILVLGATGQQGGSVARALRARGWDVKALVRDVNAERATALGLRGIHLVQGDYTDMASIATAMAGAYGVFSVQPSSGQGIAYGVTDEDETRYGKAIAHMADAILIQRAKSRRISAVSILRAPSFGQAHSWRF